MEHPYISSIFQRLFTGGLLMLVFLSCAGQRVRPAQKTTDYPHVAGQYQEAVGNERLFLNDDKTFFCINNQVQQSDVVIPRCDTLAKGIWNQEEGFVTLKNNSNFNKIEYTVLEAEAKSGDSVYFEIVLPEEDALNYKNFKFSIITSPLIGQFIEASAPAFAISKKSWGDVTFGLVIQNIAPVCDYGRKPYQRIYFNVFENYKPRSNSLNSFTITIKNFNQCFYEAMDIDGEVMGIETNGLFWKGNTYKKIK